MSMPLRAGYKQTEMGVIPEDWQLRPMLSAVRVANGQVDPKIEPYRSMILVAPDHIESGSGRLLKKETADNQRAISGKYLFEAGDIVYSKIRPYLRKAILSDFHGLCSADMYPLKPVADVSAGFILATILGHHFSKYTESVSVRSGMPKINRAELADYTIALPPTKAEQEAIAEALSDADALIKSLEQLSAKKRHVKKGAMLQLLTGKKRLSGFSAEWEFTQLGAIIEQFVGGGTPSRSISHYWNGEIPWVTVKDFATFNPHHSQESISRAGLRNSASHLIPKGTLITSTRMALGKAVIYEVDVTINQDLKALFPKPVLTTAYLYFWFQYHENLIDELGSGSTVKGISLPDLKKIQFELPPLPEQTAIATILSDMDTEIAELEAQLAKARTIKQGMMNNLLTGKIRLI